MTQQEEITRRRTFAVIAHPDAGKTTLTEKLLLFGGAIHVAGAVKSNKIKKGATSDFMEIERQRGISVATAVMGFEYRGCKINILDTPGHEDFAEDTYRTLTAVDSVIIVIDGAKGVEAQTRKLMEVCRMRQTPVIVFINKLDRPSKEPFDLLDEVEKELHIRVRPLAFPISNGPTFKGVYNLYEKNLSLFTSDEKLTADASTAEISDLASQELEGYIGEKFAAQLRSDVELVEGVYDQFDRDAYLRGELAPVFFGSAVNNFGVRELLECFVRIAPSPRPAPTETRQVEPAEPKMTGFVFKIHANMDPNHRDRIAFLKICSGTFERNRNYLHVRSGKQLKFSSPTAFMAEKKSVIDFAYPGDIVGLHDTGNFKIGDTFTEGEKLRFTGIPSFAPEQFRYIENADPLKFKQLAKGIDQLMDEGVAQLFTSSLNGRKIIGTVGALQFEVIQYRLEHEYNAACRWEPISIYKACWIDSDNAAQLADFKRRKHTNMAVDKHGRDVFLAATSYGAGAGEFQGHPLPLHLGVLGRRLTLKNRRSIRLRRFFTSGCRTSDHRDLDDQQPCVFGSADQKIVGVRYAHAVTGTERFARDLGRAFDHENIGPVAVKIHAIPGFPPGVEVERMEPCRLVNPSHVFPAAAFGSHDQPELVALRGREFDLVVTGRMALGVGDDPDLQELHRLLAAGVHLAVRDARTGGHHLQFARLEELHVAHAVAVPQGARENERNDLHILVGMRSEPLARGHGIVVEHAQGAEMNPPGIVVSGEAESMVGPEPAVIGIPAGRGSVNRLFHNLHSFNNH